MMIMITIIIIIRLLMLLASDTIRPFVDRRTRAYLYNMYLLYARSTARIPILIILTNIFTAQCTRAIFPRVRQFIRSNFYKSKPSIFQTNPLITINSTSSSVSNGACILYVLPSILLWPVLRLKTLFMLYVQNVKTIFFYLPI